MAKIKSYQGENVRAKFTFENGVIYEAELKNTDDKIIKQLEKDDKEANTKTTPIGIISSNTLSIQIIDNFNRFVIVNKKSPYYGYMKDGVRIDLFRQSNDGWVHFGVYYTDTWNSAIEYGSGHTTNLYCYDRLNWLGNKEIPKIPAFTSLSAVNLLKTLFEGCGLKVDEYEISSELDLSISYSVTKGKLMRDTLNEIAQALLARITCDRFGKIIVKPAFSGSANIGELDTECMQGLNIKHNTDTMYKHVKLDYNKVGIGASQVLAKLDDVQLAIGTNFIDDIDIGNNCQGIDKVRVSYKSDETSSFKVTSMHYVGFQNGLSVAIMANTPTKANIIVEGRRSSNNTAVEYSVGANEDTSQNNILKLSNIYIQDEMAAKNYVAKVKNYVAKIAHQYTINHPEVGLDMECGKYFTIPSSSDYGGTLYIKGVRFSIGETYKCVIDAIKVG